MLAFPPPLGASGVAVAHGPADELSVSVGADAAGIYKDERQIEPQWLCDSGAEPLRSCRDDYERQRCDERRRRTLLHEALFAPFCPEERDEEELCAVRP